MNRKVVMVASLATVIGCASISYVAKTKIDKAHQSIAIYTEKLKASLPPSLLMERKIQEGLLSSNGEIVVFSKDDAQNKMSIKYILSHGVLSWLGAEARGDISVSLSGEAAQYLGLNDEEANLATIHAAISNTGIKAVYHVKSLTITDEDSNIQVEPFHGDVLYDKNSGKISTSASVARITVPNNAQDKNDSFIISNLKLDYSFFVDNMYLDSLTLKLGKLSNDHQELSVLGLQSHLKATYQEQSHDISFNTKIDNLTFAEEKNAQLSLGLSMQGIDNRWLEIFNILHENPEKINDKLLKEKMAASLIKGLTIGIDELHYQNPENTLDFSAQYKLQPVASWNDFSLLNQSEMDTTFLIQGPMSMMVALLSGNQDKSSALSGKFEIKASYNNKDVKVNGVSAPQWTQSFTQLLTNANQKLVQWLK